MQSILLASNNPGKLREMQAILSELELRLLRPVDLGLKLEVIEDGLSYAGNALKKARAFADASGLAVLADDSGLEVASLGGAPGIHSHRYAPQEDASDADRCAYLLEQLAQVEKPWSARFVCTVAVLIPGREAELFEGACPGQIIQDSRGDKGFGYDPIFQIDGLRETMAELPDWVKNRISHRAIAVGKAIPYLNTHTSQLL